MRINPDTIPDELKRLNQWVCWRQDQKKGKVPYVADSESKARVTEKGDFRSFDEAMKFTENKHDGVGFVFTNDDPYCFIDLDGCLDIDTGTIDEESLKIIKILNSYTEISQSGKGLHIIVKAKIPEWSGNRKGHFEIYELKRYCAMTGNILDGFASIIEPRQEEVDKLCKEMFEKIPETTNKKRNVESLSDQKIIDRANKARNGSKFKKLMDGQWQGDYKSQSDADLALCSILAFYTSNSEQIDSIFRTGKLYREKWEREDYRARTIGKALNQLKKTEAKNKTVIEEEPPILPPPSAAKYFEDKTFIPSRLGNDILKKHDFIYNNDCLYMYANGFYKIIDEEIINLDCRTLLYEAARINRLKETIAHIKTYSYKEGDIFDNEKYLINVENGMYDVKASKLIPHSRDYLSSVRIPIKYNPDADPGMILKWLTSTLPEPDCVRLAIEIFGYALIPDTTMGKAFMLTGSGSNGKSTFITVLERFIGEDNKSNIPLQELSDNRFKRAELLGKLLNVFADLDNMTMRSTSYFKTIVTGDTIDAERKNKDPFKFKPFARLVYSANEIPKAIDKSYAYYRRWCIIPFNQKFEGNTEIKGFADLLSSTENLSALLLLALDGLNTVLQRGFTIPDVTKDALEEYQRQNDPVKAFIDESCEFVEDARVKRTDLYLSFCQYCEESGFHSITNRNFYQKIRILKQVNEIMDANGHDVFCGIKVKEDKK